MKSARRPYAGRDRGPAIGQEPVPGLYRTRLVRGGPWLPAKSGTARRSTRRPSEPLDRPHRLQAIIAGELHDPHEHWPMQEISREEYERLVAALGDDVRVKRDLGKEPPLW